MGEGDVCPPREHLTVLKSIERESPALNPDKDIGDAALHQPDALHLGWLVGSVETMKIVDNLPTLNLTGVTQ